MKKTTGIILKTWIAFYLILMASCGDKAQEKELKDSPKSIVEKVDDAVAELKSAANTYQTVATLDHHRMAAEEGVYTPPAIVSIFSSSEVNTPLIQEDQLTGLDLPFKVLCYSEPDTTKVSVAYTSGTFIAKRHGLPAEKLSDYNAHLSKVLSRFDEGMISETNLDSVGKGFGLIQIQSDFDFTSTVEALRNIVMAQSDTKWFGDIDYQQEGAGSGVALRPTTLLLFGGPAPGGKAMMTSPKIGLDAFCQKLLVYENAEGEVWIAFNDIVAFAKLYYNTPTKPQEVINQRLTMTFTKAVSNQAEN